MEKDKRFCWIYDSDKGLKSQNSIAKNSGIREELEWIKRQLEYASFAEKCKTRYDIKKGEIFEIDWGVNVNAEFSSRHYGVVIADSGPYNPLVMVCPLKTNHQGAHPRSDVDLGYVMELNSYHPTLAVVNQIRTVDKLRIFTKNVINQNQSGVSEKDENMAPNLNETNSIPRLNDEKLQKIINAYISMIVTGDI